LGTFKPGWVETNAMGEYVRVYYDHSKNRAEDVPFMGHMDVPITQLDIVAHSFELTASERLPAIVLKATDEDYRVWWSMIPWHLKPGQAKADTTSAIDYTPHEMVGGRSCVHDYTSDEVEVLDYTPRENRRSDSSRHPVGRNRPKGGKAEHDGGHKRAREVTQGSVAREARRSDSDGPVENVKARSPRPRDRKRARPARYRH
jgi:hypothetical protein